MKTTLDLPDDLMRAIKVRAAEDDRKLKDLVEELLRRGLASGLEQPVSRSRRVTLPLIVVAHPAAPEDQLTPERVAAILLEEEVRAIAEQ